MPDKNEKKVIPEGMSRAEAMRLGYIQPEGVTVVNKSAEPMPQWVGGSPSESAVSQQDYLQTLPTPKATPMGVVDSDGVSDNRYAKNSGSKDMYNLLGNSMLMTPEEEERRKRRAEAAAAVGNLGKLMSGFANLYYVNKGAPSQVLPNDVMPDYMSFQDRVTQARQAALNNELARKRIINEERKQTRLEEDQRLRFRKQDWIEKYQAGLLDLKAEANRINEEYKQGQISIQERNAASRELNAMAAMIRANASSQTAAANASYKNWQMQPEHLEKEYDMYGNVTSQTKGRGGKQVVEPTNDKVKINW